MKKWVFRAGAVLCLLTVLFACSVSALTINTSSTLLRTYSVPVRLNTPKGGTVTGMEGTAVSVELWMSYHDYPGNMPDKTSYSYRYTLPALTCTGYHFDGWYTNAACTVPFAPSYETAKVTDSTVLYAKWGTWNSTVTVTPTCQRRGPEVQTCSGCGESNTVTLPKLSHTYGEPVWTWSEDLTSASAAFSCSGCGTTAMRTATVVSEQIKEPSMSEDGLVVYTATAKRGSSTYTDRKELVLASIGSELIRNVVFTRDPETGAVTAENLPEGVVVLLAAYDGGRMVWCSVLTGETPVSVPEADTLRAFFLTEDHVPVTAYREITF